MIIAELTDAEVEARDAWISQHEKSCTLPHGTIGDRYYYRVTPTGIGTFVRFFCACGYWIDIVDGNNF